MRDSMEPRKKKYVKVYVFLSCGQNFVNKCCPKFVNQVKRSGTDVLKVISKRAIWKITEATGNFMEKIADKILSKLKDLESMKKFLETAKERQKQKRVDELLLYKYNHGYLEIWIWMRWDLNN